MADKFDKLGLNGSMSYQEIKTALRKQKQTWTTRESNGSDKIRRDAEAMTDLISQLRELLDQLPEDSAFLCTALETYAVFAEKDTVSMEKLTELILQADQGDMDARMALGVFLADEGRKDLAEEWAPNLVAAARAAEQEEARKQEEAQKPAQSTPVSSSASTSSTSSTLSTSSYNYSTPRRKSHKFRNFVILVILILAALAIFGEEKGHPIHNAQALVQNLLHRNTAEDSAEQAGSDPVMQSAAVEAPEPFCQWDLSQGFAEIRNGYQTEPFGDVQTVDVLGDGSLMAASFDGDGDYLSLGNAYNMSENFTLNVVLCCLDTQKSYSAFFAKYETSGEGPYAYSINQGRINCWVSTENGSVNEDSEAVVETGTWYLISIVRDGNSLQLYVNGQPDVSLDITGVIANEDLVTIGRQALLFDPVEELQFTGYIRYVDLYTETLSQDVIQHICEEQQIAGLPRLRGLRTTEGDVPLWTETGNGDYEILEYLPWNATAVFLEDVDDEYVRVSYHGLCGYVNRSYLTDIE